MNRESNPTRYLFAFALLFLGSRLLALATASPAIYTQDELYNGALALEFADGRGLSPLLLNVHAPYCGGPLALAGLMSTLFGWIEPSLALLRLPSILLASATATLWLDIVSRSFGARARMSLAALLLFSPFAITRLQLLAWANHTESTFFTTVAVAIFVRLFGVDDQLLADPGKRKRTTIAAIVAGLAGGLALFLSYAALVSIVPLAGVLIARGRRVVGSRIGLGFAAGLAIGSLPAVALAQFWHERGLASLAATSHSHLGAAPRRVFGLLLFEVRHFLMPAETWPRAIAWLPWIAVGVATLVVLARVPRALREGRLPVEWLLFAPVACFTLLYAITSFPIGPPSAGFMGLRYLIVITPALLTTLAVVISRLPPKWARRVTIALVLPHAIEMARAIPHASTYACHASPASYIAYGIHTYETLGYEVEPTLATLRRIRSPQDRENAIRGAAIRDIAHRYARMEETGAAAIARYLCEYLPLSGDDQPVFVERLALALLPPGRLQLDPAAAMMLLVDLGSSPDAESLAPIATTIASASAPTPEVISRFEAGSRFREAILRGVGIHLERLDDAEAWSGDQDAIDWGRGYERTRSTLVGGIKRPPLSSVYAIAGAETALRDFEPEDPVRRAVAATRVAIAPLNHRER